MRTKLSIALAVLALALSGGASQALTLADVTTFDSGDGSLTFSNFSVTQTKRLSADLSQYTITATATGFALSSPQFTANAGGLRKFDLKYTVTAKAGTITAATMTMEATRETGRIKIQKDIDSADDSSDVGTFLLTLLTSGNSILQSSDTFSPGQASFVVDENIRIKKISALASVTNGYTATAVAEPTTLSLLAAGLGGLTWIGRRRPKA